MNTGHSRSRPFTEFDDPEEIDTNGVIAALDKRKGTYLRARVLSNNFDEATISTLYSVFYIDYGYTGLCEWNELFRLSDSEIRNLPPRCFECRLAEVQPAIIQSETHDWSPEANDTFRQLIDDTDGRVTAEVSHIIMHINFWALRRLCIRRTYTRFVRVTFVPITKKKLCAPAERGI